MPVKSFFSRHTPARFFTSGTVICAEVILLCVLSLSILSHSVRSGRPWPPGLSGMSTAAPAKESYIKWVDFNVTSQALNDAFRYDVDTVQSPVHLNWIELLAYLGAKYGGDFSHYQKKDLDVLANALTDGSETMAHLTEHMQYYSYYLEAYTAVLGGMVGEFESEIPSSQAPAYLLPSGIEGGAEGDPEKVWAKQYGLKAFSPIAKHFPYSDYDDFGAARDYGYRRQHLGHDFLGQTGTPIIAVESGVVEAIGWNQYGGWRLGIRSFDKKRYYYYAHLRKNYPYQSCLEEGSIVQAGDVIGYLGRTGYSTTENTNNIDESHLHFGIQLIFDESQKEGNHEIWIDCYELSKFLRQHQSETQKIEGTKEWNRIYDFRDPAVPSS